MTTENEEIDMTEDEKQLIRILVDTFHEMPDSLPITPEGHIKQHLRESTYLDKNLLLNVGTDLGFAYFGDGTICLHINAKHTFPKATISILKRDGVRCPVPANHAQTIYFILRKLCIQNGMDEWKFTSLVSYSSY